MRHEWQKVRPDGCIETWDIEFDIEPSFHLYEEGAEDRHHPKMKCPVCNGRLFDVGTAEDKNQIKIVNLDFDKGGNWYQWANIKFRCPRCHAALGIQTHDESALQLYLPKVGLLLM